jgi:hypothetical protein
VRRPKPRARPTRRSRAARPARKKTSAKPRTAKKPAKKAAKKPATKQAAKKRAARRRAPTSARTPQPAKRSRLQLVRPRTPRAKPAPAPSFPQREGASAKHLVVFEMLRARAAFHAAIQGLGPGAASRPLAPGAWSVREHVLHLCHWDEQAVHQVEPVSRGTPPPWHANTKEDDDRMNAEAQARLAHLGWDDALRRLHMIRAELIEALEFVSSDPAEPWLETHPLGYMLRDIASHDRHHADVIKRWRSEQGL